MNGILVTCAMVYVLVLAGIESHRQRKEINKG